MVARVRRVADIWRKDAILRQVLVKHLRSRSSTIADNERRNETEETVKRFRTPERQLMKNLSVGSKFPD